jgi:putative transposase
LEHHVTQRGNRRQTVFFEPADYALYRDLLAERCRKASVEVWAYCLMPNHVHLVLAPSTPDGLARAIGKAHRQYTGFINARARKSCGEDAAEACHPRMVRHSRNWCNR